MKKAKECYITKQEKGKEESFEVKEFIENLIQNKAINNHSKQHFMEYPEDLVFILNSEEKRFGRKYKVKYKK